MHFRKIILPMTMVMTLVFSSPSFAQYDSSQVKLWSEISEYRRTKDTTSLATAYHLLAMIKQFGMEQDSALYYLLKMRELFALRSDTGQINQTNALIGHWYIGNGDPGEALRYFRDGYRYFKTKHDTILIAHSLANMALAFEKLHQDDSSIIYRNQSLPLAYYIRDSFLIMIDLWSLSESARNSGNLQQALPLAEEASMWSEMNEKNHLHYAAIVFNKAEILWLQKKYADALPIYQESLNAIPTDQNPELRSNAYRRISDCYEHLRQFEKALAFQKLHQQINEQLLNEKRQKSIEQLRIQFETENKEKEIGLLQQQNLLISAEAARKKRFYLVLSIALGALVSISALAYFINRRRLHAQQLIHLQSEKIHQQQLIELEQQHHINSMKEILAGQDAERERIARDLHDSLGGLLSGIKMHFQKLRSTETDHKDQLEETTSALINQACDSVRTISHNMMPDSLSKFGLQEALNDLVEKSNVPGLTIWLNCHGLESRMEREKELAIYRIVEEAIGNIVRHAKASEVFINVLRNENLISLSIEDNGVGFDSGKISGYSSGLSNMQSRVSILKGSFNIESLPERGTFISVAVPVYR